MSKRTKGGLVIYFSALMIISLYVLIYIWPEAKTINTFQMSNHTKFSKQKTEINFVSKNQTSESIRNKTILMLPNKTVSDIFDNQSLQPSQGQTTSFHSESLVANNEVRLLILAVLFGILGACVEGVTSLSTWIARKNAGQSWQIWYLVRPPLGAALSVITYLIIRAGLIQGSGINDFGVSAVSALVGLMTVQMTHKLKDIFDSLFGRAKANVDNGEYPAKDNAVIKLDPPKAELKLKDKIDLRAKVTKSNGKPIENVEVIFSTSHTNFVEIEPHQKNTDSEGIASTRLTGKKIGSAVIKVIAKIETVYGRFEYIENSASIEIVPTE